MRDVNPYLDEGLLNELLDFERADPRRKTRPDRRVHTPDPEVDVERREDD